MPHIDEKTLELYVLEAAQIQDRRAEIESHVKDCSRCSALLDEIREYYTEVRSLAEEHTHEDARALTLSRMIMRVPPFADRGSLREVPKTLPARFVLFVIRRPVVSVFSLVSLFAAGLALVSLQGPAKDPNPAYARAKEEFLVVYNKEGKELWRKHIAPGYDSRVLPHFASPDEYLTTVDVDGDGVKEVIAIPQRQLARLNDDVVCYTPGGDERWRHELHYTVVFGDQSFSDDYFTYHMMVGDFDANGDPEVVVSLRHDPYWPSAIIKLDARNGAPVGEYWHPGHLYNLSHRDIDGDGIEELFAVGESNAFDRPSVVVLDPSKIAGHAPGTKEYLPQGIQQGFEKYYIMLPSSDLRDLSSHPRTVGVDIEFKADGSIEVRTGVQMREVGVEIFYYFDNILKCKRVVPSDDFVLLHRRLEAEGKLTKKVDEHYARELLQGVQYWDGEKFVKEPVMNKRYVDSMLKKPPS